MAKKSIGKKKTNGSKSKVKTKEPKIIKIDSDEIPINKIEDIVDTSIPTQKSIKTDLSTPRSGVELNQTLLLATAFAIGASIMILGLVGSRIMAPYYGLTIFTLMSILSIILVFMSLGYWYGGKISDKELDGYILSKYLFLACITLFLIPFTSNIILEMSLDLGFRLGAIISALLIFALPSFFISMITPILIKSLTKKGVDIGRSIGLVLASSTLGAVIGTFSVGMLVIPYIMHSTIIFFLALLLAGLSLVLNSRAREPHVRNILLMVFMVFFLYEPFYVKASNITYFEQTPQNQILIEGDGINRFMYLDGRDSGAINLDDNLSINPYVYFFQLPFVLREGISNVLIAGEGTGVSARQIRMDNPDVSVKMVELDGRVKKVAEDYFGMGEDPKIDVVVDDFRHFLRVDDGIYDLIIFDVYNDRPDLPQHLVTREFFQDMKTRMPEDGVVLYNVFATVSGEKSEIFTSILSTVELEFDHVQVYPTGLMPQHYQNILILASNQPLNQLSINSKMKPTNTSSKDEILMMLSTKLDPDKIQRGGAVIFTDEYSPIDTMYYSKD